MTRKFTFGQRDCAFFGVDRVKDSFISNLRFGDQ